MIWLPVDEQANMAVDVVAWMCAGLPPAERQIQIARLAPRLLDRIREGQFGLRLVIYYHLLRLPPLRCLRQWMLAVQDCGQGWRPGRHPAGGDVSRVTDWL
jgi:hypothetical protein